MLNSINNLYSVGLYIRLSHEDFEKVTLSESIVNQKSLLLQYTKENNLKVYDIYIDDGYSGTTFDRPAFKRLLRDIELKKINMVITKDMSRLGRDYIGTGNLIEKYFPEHNIRYIAITDNIDTFLDSSNNDIAPFKAIMNDMYAKDISKKIKTSLKAKMKEGKWVGAKAPFGYEKDSKVKNHLIINPEQAFIVKKIYSMCLEGLSFYKIAQELTMEGFKTPSQYSHYDRKNYLTYGKWHPKTIRDILTNRVYIGDMIQSKRIKVNYKVKKVVPNNPNNYIIALNTHEPIIAKETFDVVQRRIPKNKGRTEKKELHLLDGLLYCGECGKRISVTPRRKKDNRCYTICNYYRTYRKEKLCTTHSNNYDELEKNILNSLQKITFDSEKIKTAVLNKLQEKLETKKDQEQELLLTIEKIKSNLDELYLDKLNKVITKDQYERIKKKLENNLYLTKKNYEALKRPNGTKKMQLDILKINKYIDDFLSFQKPQRELIVNLIERIDILENKTITIKVTFEKDN